jgi:hypothetical protein
MTDGARGQEDDFYLIPALVHSSKSIAEKRIKSGLFAIFQW